MHLRLLHPFLDLTRACGMDLLKNGCAARALKATAEFLMADVAVMGNVIIGLAALSSDLSMRYLEHKLVPWKGKM